MSSTESCLINLLLSKRFKEEALPDIRVAGNHSSVCWDATLDVNEV